MLEDVEKESPTSIENDRSIATAHRWRRRRWFFLVLVVVAAFAGFVFRNPLFRRNFAVVEPGMVFRSAQPRVELRELIAAKGVASILNLRGGSLHDRFYVDELQVSDATGVAFYDFPMSAIRRPSRRELLILIDFFERCRYPLLIHCKSGSDRTGLACALYLMARSGQPPEEAARAFSLFYGHVPLGGTVHLHEPLLEYAQWLKEHQVPHTPQRLRAWVEHDYPSADPALPGRPLQAGPRAVLLGRAAH